MTELDAFICKKCRSRAGFIFEPKKQGKRDLQTFSNKLKEKGAKINALTPLVLAAKYNGTLINFFANGKAIVKNESEEKAKQILKELL